MSNSAGIDFAAVRAWRAPLLRWYSAKRRDLPWRRTRDPYAIWVSEVMLQQTTVAAVIPYWERFVERLPTVESLAAASDDAVLGLWSGLGYYRRARALRDGARIVCERFGGRLPSEVDTLREIPGVGRYTAGAIASVAFDREAPIVDGNVRRVYARLLARDGHGDDPIFWEVAAALVRGKQPGDLNQAVMELGATLCTPRTPRCTECPLRSRCQAFATGRQQDFPARRATPVPRALHVAAAVVLAGDRVLVERRSDATPLRGAWDVPARVIATAADAPRVISEVFRRDLGLRATSARVAGVARHSILDMRLSLEVITFEASPSADRPDWRWIGLDALAEAPISAASRKAVGVALAHDAASHNPPRGGSPRPPSSRRRRGISTDSLGSGRSNA